MNIEISTGQLNSDIRRMQDQLDALRNAKERVYRQLEQLNTMWDGNANSVFMAQTRVDEQVMQEMLENLNDLISCMEFASQEYDRCTEEVDSKIASIRLSGDT